MAVYQTYGEVQFTLPQQLKEWSVQEQEIGSFPNQPCGHHANEAQNPEKR